MSYTTSIDWSGPPRQPCPACGRSSKDRTCGVTIEHDGSGVAHCFRCEYVETYRDERTMQRPGAAVARSTPHQKHEVLSEFGRELLATCRQLAGDAAAYLEARACVIPPADGDLRWHPALKHPLADYIGPALVGLVTDAITREPLTLHRTWIRADGRKAPLDPPRMLLGGHRKAGGVIRLWPDEDVSTGLAISEGIETALALAHAYRPVWACMDAGNLAEFPVLPGIECLTIAADCDPAGISAAERCAERWHSAGREVHIITAPTPGHDIADVAALEAE